MLRQNPSSRSNPEDNQPTRLNAIALNRDVDFDVQRELDRLEELVLDSPRIPLTRQTLVDEDKILNQLDLVRMNLPEAFEKALAVIEQKQDILLEAEQYGQKMIQMAQQRAAQILDETGIIQHAQQEASQIRQQVQQECEALQRQTLAEIEQARTQTQQELQQFRQQTMAECQQFRQQTVTECQQIQEGADQYADVVLTNIEQQLNEMLRVVLNGRQQLQPNSQPQNTPPKKLPGTSGKRSQSPHNHK